MRGSGKAQAREAQAGAVRAPAPGLLLRRTRVEEQNVDISRDTMRDSMKQREAGRKVTWRAREVRKQGRGCDLHTLRMERAELPNWLRWWHMSRAHGGSASSSSTITAEAVNRRLPQQQDARRRRGIRTKIPISLALDTPGQI